MDISIQRPGKDPLLQCDFIVEIEGVAVAGFMEFTEPQKTKGEAKYREGNMANRPHKQLGLESIADVTLKRGEFVEEEYLYNWYQSGSRKQVDIVAMKHGRDGDRRVKTFRYYEVTCKDFKAGKGDAMSEDGIRVDEAILSIEDWDINP